MATEEEVEYRCVLCGSRIGYKDIEERGGYIRCPNQHCRSRILRKVRPPGIKHVRCD